MNKYIAAALLLVLVAGGIYTVSQLDSSTEVPNTNSPSSNAVNAQYGEVTLKVGQIAQFPDVSLEVLSVSEDSRCPQGVQCIWAGTVKVNTRVVSAMGTSTAPIGLGSSVTTEAEEISLISVAPAQKQGSTIAQTDYLLTFKVSKRSVSSINPPAGKCYIGGCSSQLCTDEPDAVSTCEYREQYGCYKNATCERQTSGECGWTQTATLQICLNTNL